MRLTAPTKIVFYASLLVMLVGLVLYLFVDDAKDAGYIVTLGGGFLLSAGVVLDGF